MVLNRCVLHARCVKVIDLWAVQVWGWFVMIGFTGFYLLNLIPLFFISISIYLSFPLFHFLKKSEVILIELNTWVSIDVFKIFFKLSQHLKNPGNESVRENNQKAIAVSMWMLIGCWFRNLIGLRTPSNPLVLNLFYIVNDIYSIRYKISILCISDVEGCV